MSKDEYKIDLLDAIIKAGDKLGGKGFTSKLSSKDIISRVTITVSTSSPGLDRVLAKDADDNFGMPVGRVIGVQGKEASGKTTLINAIMSAVQKRGGIARLYETEMAYDPEYAEECGVNADEVLFSQPDFLEQMLNGIKSDIKVFQQARKEYEDEHEEPWDVFLAIFVDSIAGSPPKAEYELGDFEDDQARALHARILSKFFRWVTKRLAREKICLIMTNQTKVDTNVKWGSRDTAIGGKALRFHASIMLELNKIGNLKLGTGDNAEQIGIITEMKTTKNKMLVPFKKVNVPIVFGKGIDYDRALFMMLKDSGVIKTGGGGWFKLKAGRIELKAKGMENFLIGFKDFTKKARMRNLLEGLVDD